MAHQATLRHESPRISCQKSVILSERSESKDLYLLFAKLTFNRAGGFSPQNECRIGRPLGPGLAARGGKTQSQL
jgi:hypothetical protein